MSKKNKTVVRSDKQDVWDKKPRRPIKKQKPKHRHFSHWLDEA
jgi:hypothetical protein